MAFHYDNVIGSGDKETITRCISRIMIAKICKLLNIDWSLQFFMGHTLAEERGNYLEDILEYLHVTNSDFEWDEETSVLQLNLDLPIEQINSLIKALCSEWYDYLWEEVEDEETGELIEFKSYNDKGVALNMKYYRGVPCLFFKEYYEMILKKGTEKNDK